MGEARQRTRLDRTELDAWAGMLRTHSRTIAALDAELEREHGLSLTSYEVLLSLAEAPEHSLRMGELADRLLLSRSGLTRMVDRLVRDGLVERRHCETDRRGYYARLTDEGAERFAAARPTHLDGVRRYFLDRLRRSDVERLGTIWRRLEAGS